MGGRQRNRQLGDLGRHIGPLGVQERVDLLQGVHLKLGLGLVEQAQHGSGGHGCCCVWELHVCLLVVRSLSNTNGSPESGTKKDPPAADKVAVVSAASSRPLEAENGVGQEIPPESGLFCCCGGHGRRTRATEVSRPKLTTGKPDTRQQPTPKPPLDLRRITQPPKPHPRLCSRQPEAMKALKEPARDPTSAKSDQASAEETCERILKGTNKTSTPEKPSGSPGPCGADQKSRASPLRSEKRFLGDQVKMGLYSFGTILIPEPGPNILLLRAELLRLDFRFFSVSTDDCCFLVPLKLVQFPIAVRWLINAVS